MRVPKTLLALLVVSLALAALVGARPAAAIPPENGYIWGPNGSWMNMRPPFNDGPAHKAIAMAVDCNTISQRFLGEPWLLEDVEDASPETAVVAGSCTFAPDISSDLLRDAGVTDLTFTIAGATDGRLAAKMAEAIASDLRANIGANVTVMRQPADADYIVRRAMQPPPPPNLPFEFTCTPETFRLGFWVPVECVFRITNTGSVGVGNIYLMLGAFYGDVVPEWWGLSMSRDGDLVPTDMMFYVGETFQPGQSVEIRSVDLWWFGEEGAGQTEWELFAGGRAAAVGTIPYQARADTGEPPKDLLVERRIVAGGNGDGEVVYETTITNQGSSTVTNLTLTERYGYYGNQESFSVEADPPPSSQRPDVQLVTWDLPALGKESLAPGESLLVKTVYSQGFVGDGCESVDTGAMVEATVDGAIQRYGAKVEHNPVPIRCPASDANDTGGGSAPADQGETGVVVPPRSGDGPSSSGDLAWVAALVAVGVSLVGAALALLRRARL